MFLIYNDDLSLLLSTELLHLCQVVCLDLFAVKSAHMERQLYDVLAVMLGYAIKDYNMFHLLILDTINNITGLYSF